MKRCLFLIFWILLHKWYISCFVGLPPAVAILFFSRNFRHAIYIGALDWHPCFLFLWPHFTIYIFYLYVLFIILSCMDYLWFYLFLYMLFIGSIPTWVLLSHSLVCTKRCTCNIDKNTRKFQHHFLLYIPDNYTFSM